MNTFYKASNQWEKLYELYSLRNRMGMAWPIVSAYEHADFIMEKRSSTTVKLSGTFEEVISTCYSMNYPGGANGISINTIWYPVSVLDKYAPLVMSRIVPRLCGEGDDCRPLTWSEYLLDEIDLEFKRDWIKTFKLTKEDEVLRPTDISVLTQMMSSKFIHTEIFDNDSISKPCCRELDKYRAALKRLATFALVDILYYYTPQQLQ